MIDLTEVHRQLNQRGQVSRNILGPILREVEAMQDAFAKMTNQRNELLEKGTLTIATESQQIETLAKHLADALCFIVERGELSYFQQVFEGKPFDALKLLRDLGFGPLLDRKDRPAIKPVPL